LDRRLAGLADEPRLGAPRRITDDQVEEVIVARLVSAPVFGLHAGLAGACGDEGLHVLECLGCLTNWSRI
jgi:hypothetical protein